MAATKTPNDEISLLDYSWIEKGRLLAGSVPTCPEDIRLLHRLGVRSILSLTEEGLDFYDLPAELLSGLGIVAVHRPIPDTFPPEMADVPGLLREISYLKGSAPSLYIHCHAGFGRTGTVLHLHYLHRGMMLRDVQQRVAATRPGCTHLTDAQLQFLGRYQQGLLLRDQPVPPSAPVVQQAAALPLRHGPNGLETLLITSSAGDCWLIPKGHIEADETAPETARKEAEEEAGVRGRLSPASIGEFSYTKYGIRYRAEAFALHVTEILREWDECSIRSRQWVGLAEAADVVALPTLSELLKSLPSRLAEPPAPPNSTE